MLTYRKMMLIRQNSFASAQCMKRKQNRSANLIREDSHLPAVMTMPNSMSLEWGYEEHRDLVTSMTYKRGTTVVAARGYTYDKLGRPITRQTTRQGSMVNDTFTYNSRSELIGATVNGKVYGYSYDNIGNRKTAQEDAEEATAYTANPLNQYTAIQQGSGEEGEND